MPWTDGASRTVAALMPRSASARAAGSDLRGDLGLGTSASVAPRGSPSRPDVTMSGRFDPSSTPQQLDHFLILNRGFEELREVVAECGMDHRIRARRRTMQHLRIFERAFNDQRARRDERIGLGFIAGEAR